MKIKLKMTEKLWQGWKYWKNKTQLEKDAIDSMLKAKDYILKNIPKKEIVSIYVYGSFVRREMTKDSDVDLFVILKSHKYLSFSEKITMKAISSWKVR
ncbi:MAG TPA: nucleotidyltransferase domain-containing protein, partial [Candidatus Nanoarchaeia archaeon]|nr:nucleotidyltransferase domain-containing protein [Candidatus Nanoarchaeia archaeon]